jgi:hypothetical protein
LKDINTWKIGKEFLNMTKKKTTTFNHETNTGSKWNEMSSQR